MERELIKMTKDEISEFWNALYFEKSQTKYNKQTYTHVERINTSEYCDGECWDYIVQRKSDKKFFKFEVWDTGNEYNFGDNFLTEVFRKKITKFIYE
jgi:hypothetical protein